MAEGLNSTVMTVKRKTFRYTNRTTAPIYFFCVGLTPYPASS